jgi:hypothetical protein
MLNQVQPCQIIEDRRRWLASTTGDFSVKSTYVGLLNRTMLDALDDVDFDI